MSTAPFFYPDNHSRLFNGDLIVSTPDINHFRVSGDDNVLLLACDGLWDVLDPDDAVRLTRKLVFERGLSARESVSSLFRCQESVYFIFVVTKVLKLIVIIGTKTCRVGWPLGIIG